MPWDIEDSSRPTEAQIRYYRNLMDECRGLSLTSSAVVDTDSCTRHEMSQAINELIRIRSGHRNMQAASASSPRRPQPRLSDLLREPFGRPTSERHESHIQVEEGIWSHHKSKLPSPEPVYVRDVRYENTQIRTRRNTEHNVRVDDSRYGDFCTLLFRSVADVLIETHPDMRSDDYGILISHEYNNLLDAAMFKVTITPANTDEEIKVFGYAVTNAELASAGTIDINAQYAERLVQQIRDYYRGDIHENPTDTP